MAKNNRIQVFEEIPIPKAVASLSVPTVLAMLVSVVYSLADTYFVGLLNDPVQTAAVSLAGPV
ncbi:MAG: MATE family efflux transporter, partial [Faecalibacterium sp.]|nr:MATE family efflux transporter [Faecalibacterium sp.]